jgi:hypothetical protein
MFQVALVDLRRQSFSFSARNTLYVGALRSWQLLMPPGVADGYKVIGAESGLLVYVTDRFYNPGTKAASRTTIPRSNTTGRRSTSSPAHQRGDSACRSRADLIQPARTVVVTAPLVWLYP